MVLLIIFNNINIIIILMLFLVFSNFFPTLQLFFVQLCNYQKVLYSSLYHCFCVSARQNVSREIIYCMKKPGHIANQHNNQLQVGSLTQLVEHCTGIAEVMCLVFIGTIFPLLLEQDSVSRRSLSYSSHLITKNYNNVK